jgi:hypothetical protein
MVITAVPTTLDCAAVAIDIVDAVSRSVLIDAIGLDLQAAAAVLSTLWGAK